MENEENRGLINKKAYEDQWVGWSVQDLANLALELSHTLGHFKISWSTLELEQERQRRQEEAKIKQGNAGSSNYNNILYRYRFACVFSLLDLTWMVLHVVVFYHGMVSSRCDSVLSLALPFPDSLDEMGSIM